MPVWVLNLQEAQADLSKLVDRAAGGEEIIIAKAGHPIAKLVPFDQHRVPRQPGGWEGKVWVADDFDAPLTEEFPAALESREDD